MLLVHINNILSLCGKKPAKNNLRFSLSLHTLDKLYNPKNFQTFLFLQPFLICSQGILEIVLKLLHALNRQALHLNSVLLQDFRILHNSFQSEKQKKNKKNLKPLEGIAPPKPFNKRFNKICRINPHCFTKAICNDISKSLNICKAY